MPWKTQASCISWPPMQLPAAGQESGRVIFSTVNSILQQYSILSGIKLQCLYFCLSTLFHLKGWQASTFQSFQKCVLVFRHSKRKCHFKSLNANSVSWNDICCCRRCNYLAIVYDTLFFQHQHTYISWCMWLIHILDIWSFFQFIWWKEVRHQMKYDCKFSFLNRSWIK